MLVNEEQGREGLALMSRSSARRIPSSVMQQMLIMDE